MSVAETANGFRWAFLVTLLSSLFGCLLLVKAGVLRGHDRS